MGLLADLFEASLKRDGIRVVNGAITFESFDAMTKNADIVTEIVSTPTQNKASYANWGLNNDGTPVIVDQEELHEDNH